MSPSATTSKESALPRLRWAWDFGPLLQDVDTSRLLALLAALSAATGALGLLPLTHSAQDFHDGRQPTLAGLFPPFERP